MAEQYEAVRARIRRHIEDLSATRADAKTRAQVQHLTILVDAVANVLAQACTEYVPADPAMALAARERCFTAAARMLERGFAAYLQSRDFAPPVLQALQLWPTRAGFRLDDYAYDDDTQTLTAQRPPPKRQAASSRQAQPRKAPAKKAPRKKAAAKTSAAVAALPAAAAESPSPPPLKEQQQQQQQQQESEQTSAAALLPPCPSPLPLAPTKQPQEQVQTSAAAVRRSGRSRRTAGGASCSPPSSELRRRWASDEALSAQPIVARDACRADDANVLREMARVPDQSGLIDLTRYWLEAEPRAADLAVVDNPGGGDCFYYALAPMLRVLQPAVFEQHLGTAEQADDAAAQMQFLRYVLALHVPPAGSLDYESLLLSFDRDAQRDADEEQSYVRRFSGASQERRRALQRAMLQPTHWGAIADFGLLRQAFPNVVVLLLNLNTQRNAAARLQKRMAKIKAAGRGPTAAELRANERDVPVQCVALPEQPLAQWPAASLCFVMVGYTDNHFMRIRARDSTVGASPRQLAWSMADLRSQFPGIWLAFTNQCLPNSAAAVPAAAQPAVAVARADGDGDEDDDKDESLDYNFDDADDEDANDDEDEGDDEGGKENWRSAYEGVDPACLVRGSEQVDASNRNCIALHLHNPPGKLLLVHFDSREPAFGGGELRGRNVVLVRNPFDLSQRWVVKFVDNPLETELHAFLDADVNASVHIVPLALPERRIRRGVLLHDGVERDVKVTLYEPNLGPEPSDQQLADAVNVVEQAMRRFVDARGAVLDIADVDWKSRQNRIVQAQSDGLRLLFHDFGCSVLPKSNKCRPSAVVTYVCAKTLVVFDFDQTISAQHLYHLTEGQDDVSKLTDEVVQTAFNATNDNGEYLRILREFWTQLNQIPHIEVHILSRGHGNMIRAALERIELKPMPAQIVGLASNTTFHSKWQVMERLFSERPDLSPARTLFVDDGDHERLDMQHHFNSMSVCCGGLEEGLTPEIMSFVLRWAANPDQGRRLPLQPIAEQHAYDQPVKSQFAFDVHFFDSKTVYPDTLRAVLGSNLLRDVEDLRWTFRGTKKAALDFAERPLERVRFNVRTLALAKRIQSKLTARGASQFTAAVKQFTITPHLGDLSLQNLPKVPDPPVEVVARGVENVTNRRWRWIFELKGVTVQRYKLFVRFAPNVTEDVANQARTQLLTALRPYYASVSSLGRVYNQPAYLNVEAYSESALSTVQHWLREQSSQNRIGPDVTLTAFYQPCLMEQDPRRAWRKHSVDEGHQDLQQRCYRAKPRNVPVELHNTDYIRYMVDADDTWEECLPKVDASKVEQQLSAHVSGDEKVITSFTGLPKAGVRVPLLPLNIGQQPADVLLVPSPDRPDVAHVQTSASAKSRVATIEILEHLSEMTLALEQSLVRSLPEDAPNNDEPYVLATGRNTLPNLIYLLQLAAKVARVERVALKLNRMAQLDAYAPSPDAPSHMLAKDRLGSRYHFVRGRPCEVPAVQVSGKVAKPRNPPLTSAKKAEQAADALRAEVRQRRAEMARLEALLRANRADVGDMRRLAQLKAEDVTRADVRPFE